MASTYTLNTGIELIPNGEQSGTWGDTTNVNLEIIDRLTNGVGAITLSGTTHTLTTADGSLSEGQFKVLVFGGSPSGTNTVTISPNDQDKQYFIVNNSGESIILTQGSGTSVTVADGATDIIFSDGGGTGANVVSLTADLSGVLLAANNLSDVADAAIALTNLGLTATAAELNILDGVTATTAELNILDGVTATTAELNILDGVTATTAELNILDGVTATTAELNKLDGLAGDVVGTSDTQTLTNKSLTSPELTGAIDALGSYRGNVTVPAVLDIDLSAGNYFTKAISANSTFTFTNAPASRAASFTLRVTVTGDRTITFPAAVEFAGDEAPTLTPGTTHLFMFVTDDGGTTFRGASLVDYAV